MQTQAIYQYYSSTQSFEWYLLQPKFTQAELKWNSSTRSIDPYLLERLAGVKISDAPETGR